MLEGLVNANLEAVVTIPLLGPAGQTREVAAVVDTGFNGYLTLPPTLVAELGLPVVGDGEAVLADGREAVFDVCGVTVVWGGHPRYVETAAVGTDALVGMMLLDGKQPVRGSRRRRSCLRTGYGAMRGATEGTFQFATY